MTLSNLFFYGSCFRPFKRGGFGDVTGFREGPFAAGRDAPEMVDFHPALHVGLGGGVFTCLDARVHAGRRPDQVQPDRLGGDVRDLGRHYGGAGGAGVSATGRRASQPGGHRTADRGGIPRVGKRPDQPRAVLRRGRQRRSRLPRGGRSRGGHPGGKGPLRGSRQERNPLATFRLLHANPLGPGRIDDPAGRPGRLGRGGGHVPAQLEFRRQPVHEALVVRPLGGQGADHERPSG